MIAISKDLSLKSSYDLTKIGPLNEIVFLDIETTGFTPDNSTVYLIGVMYFQQMEWHLKQWFADSLSQEEQIIQEFFLFIQDYQTLITFNGETFDIPYLKKCALQYHLETPFDLLKSFDIYKKTRPLRKLLSMESMKQKSIEEFLGLDRYDQFNGGQLIEVYKEYLDDMNENNYRFLILHNEEDLKGMVQILPILTYCDLFTAPSALISHTFDTNAGMLTLQLESEIEIPMPFSFSGEFAELICDAKHITLSLKVYTGELKFFFDNFKDYYYLPAEDQAVHKKISNYVDKTFRQQAAASTCYTRRDGVFLPLSWETSEPVFYENYRSKPAYIEYQDSPAFIEEYAKQLFSSFCPMPPIQK